MMSLGASKPWPDALEILTGQRTLDVTALLEYFKPLENWLKEENEKAGNHVGWDSAWTEYVDSISFALPKYSIFHSFFYDRHVLLYLDDKNEKPQK